jgi:hypothetical protein
VFVPEEAVNRNGDTTLVASLVNVKLLVVNVATTTGRSELVLTETVFVARYTPLTGVPLVKIVVPATLVKAAVLLIAAYDLVVVTTVFVDTTVLVTGAQSVKD